MRTLVAGGIYKLERYVIAGGTIYAWERTPTLAKSLSYTEYPTCAKLMVQRQCSNINVATANIISRIANYFSTRC
jgi:hypothetical protein